MLVPLISRHFFTRYKPLRFYSKVPGIIPDELPDWQHPVEKKEIPIELKRMRASVERELSEKEEMVREIVKNPDYQFYHQVMQYRIEKVEQEILEKRKFNKHTTKIVDKAIEEVVNQTKEEFYHYYKARDERYMSLIEQRLEMLEAGDEAWDSDAVKYLLEGDQNIQLQEEDEIKLLTEGSNLSNPWIGEDNDELDTDEIEDDEESKPFNNPEEENSKWGQEMKEIEGNAKKQRFNYDPYNSSDPDGPMYQNYEKMNLWKQELPDSPFAPVDRIMAHFRTRERELVNKKKKETEQESFDKFLKYLETDSEAKEAFKRLADEHAKIGDEEFENMIIPDPSNLEDFDKKMLAEQKKAGFNEDSIQSKKLYDTLHSQKQQGNGKQNGRQRSNSKNRR